MKYETVIHVMGTGLVLADLRGERGGEGGRGGGGKTDTVHEGRIYQETRMSWDEFSETTSCRRTIAKTSWGRELSSQNSGCTSMVCGH